MLCLLLRQGGQAILPEAPKSVTEIIHTDIPSIQPVPSSHIEGAFLLPVAKLFLHENCFSLSQRLYLQIEVLGDDSIARYEEVGFKWSQNGCR